MGLNFSNSQVSWAYSGFNSFRKRLANEIGIENLDKMYGFGGRKSWKPYQSDPIYPFINHSDCDGKLPWEECRTVAPRLRELVSKWEGVETAYDKEMALQLADDMEKHAKMKKNLIFC
jgi:hypothetical protein